MLRVQVVSTILWGRCIETPNVIAIMPYTLKNFEALSLCMENLCIDASIPHTTMPFCFSKLVNCSLFLHSEKNRSLALVRVTTSLGGSLSYTAPGSTEQTLLVVPLELWQRKVNNMLYLKIVPSLGQHERVQHSLSMLIWTQVLVDVCITLQMEKH